MKLLILGGTRFLGRHLVESALARGHTLTLFNRQQTNPGLFPQVEQLRGDRGGNLTALENRRWDAVIDTCGYVSSHVRATAQLLAGAVETYAFISSISVYSDFSRPGLDETALTARLPEHTAENEGDSNTYGARKVLCEQAVDQCLPGRALVIRPGIVAGPHDPLGRLTYWVRRTAQGGELLAPAPPDAVIQLIDVRDLSSWIVQLIERHQSGTYNATGPHGRLTFQQLLEACRAGTKSDAHTTWVDESFLLSQGVTPFTDLPLWIPAKEASHAGFFAINCQRAFEAGLICRPLDQTAQGILVADSQLPNDAPAKSIGLSAEQERELLQRWKQA